MRSVMPAALLIAACGAAPGQAAPTEFEVASVKPSPPLAGGAIRVMMRGGPGSQDPGRINYEGVTLKSLLANAYHLKQFQVSGPAWMDTERYDITATIPEGATREQFEVMLQKLLTERFKVTSHREKKDAPVYELTVGKSGSKLKPAIEDKNAPDLGPQGPPPPGPGRGELPQMPQLPPGRPNMAMRIGRGAQQVIARVQPVSQLATILSNSLGYNVVDKTGLTGTYDYTLEFTSDSSVMGAFGAFPLPPPTPPPGGDTGPPRLGAADSSNDPPNIFTAVQEQLGLKLDKKTGPVDVLVIDHAEKTPVEN